MLKHARSICLSLSAGLALFGQGYETKFKAIGFKPGDAYHSDENVHVSLNGGGLEVSIPLGPPLPGPIPIGPVVHYHGKYTQSLNTVNRPGGAELDAYVSCIENGDIFNFKRWLPPNYPFGEIHPGFLLFSLGGHNELPKVDTISVTSYSGATGSYYLGKPGTFTYRSDNPSNVEEINSLVAVLAPEWVPMGASQLPCVVHPELGFFIKPLGTTIGVRLAAGSTLIFGPSNAQVPQSAPICPKWNGNSYDWADTVTAEIPNEILQIDGQLITLWRRNRNTLHYIETEPGSGLPFAAVWDRSIFHPVWIKTRDGFKVDVEIFREAPGAYGPPFNLSGCFQGGGRLTGYRVSCNSGATWFQVGGPAGTTPVYPVSFGGMSIPGTTGPSFGDNDEGCPGGSPDSSWQPGTTSGYNFCITQKNEWDFNYAALGFSANSITYGGLTTSFQWAGPQGQLSSLTTPNGKTYTFSYDLFTGFGPNAGWANQGYVFWDYADDANARNYWSVVTQMDVSDGAQNRSTSYHWKIPQLDPASPASTSTNWISGAQGVAQTLPDGQTILHVFAPAVDLPSSTASAQFSLPISTPILDRMARTFMAQRQSPIARYYYAAGETGWNEFISSGADPESSNWYKREVLEGFDLREWEASIPRISSNTEPRPTRIIREEKGGPVEVMESDGWDPSRNQYAVSRVYHLPPGTPTAGQFWAPGLFGGGGSYPAPSGAVSHRVTNTTFASIDAGLFSRPQSVVSQQVSAPSSGTTGTISNTYNQYNSGSQAHLIQDSAQKATDGSALQLKTGFLYGAWGGFTRVSDVNLSATGLVGTAGYTFDYDGSGRWLTSIQVQGLTYKEQEPSHNWAGKPTSRIDANGVETTYTWDDLGRITGIIPPFPELPTSVVYDSDFKGAVVTRGVASTHYRYNGFGELTSVQKPTGEIKTFSYDLGGRKTFESVWSSTTEGTHSYFDTQGRLYQTVSPNGETTDIAYPNPLIKSVTQYPKVYGSPSAATTTFEHDSLGRLATVTNAKGEVTKYTYDPAGKLKKVEQGTQVRTWTFNGLGWLTGLAQPESGTTTYSDFSLFGKPRITNYAGRVVNTTYDLLGRATDVNAADGSVSQHFEFDGGIPFNGKLRYSTDRSNIDQSLLRLDFGYGGLNGRLDSLKTTEAPVMGVALAPFQQSFTYDNYGNRKTATLPSGRTVTYTYDLPRGVLQKVDADSGVPGSFGAIVAMATIQSYNPNDNPIDLILGNGTTTTFGYSTDQSRLGSMEHKKAATSLRKWIYAWDSAGQLTGDDEDTYQYDPLSRLVQANLKPLGGTSSITQAFTYDPYGNQVSSSTSNLPIGLDKNFANFTFNAADLAPANRLPAFTSQGGATGAQYDPQGNLTQLFKQVGAANRAMNLTYDALGRVIQMTDDERGVTEKYVYTAEGLRTRIETWQGSVLQKVTIKLYNDQRQLVSEYEAAVPTYLSNAAPTKLTPAVRAGSPKSPAQAMR